MDKKGKCFGNQGKRPPNREPNRDSMQCCRKRHEGYESLLVEPEREQSGRKKYGYRHTTGDAECTRLDLAEVAEHGVDELESGIDLLTDLGAGKNDLTADEDEQDDLGLHHTVDQAREELRLVGRESVMTRGQTLQADGELD